MEPTQPGNISTLDQLPILPSGVRVYEFSSKNKQGLNGDAHWHLYRDDQGHAVVFEMEGPGCVKSIWGTDIKHEQTVRFFFDGEAVPTVECSLHDFYSGKHPLFPSPLASLTLAGTWEGDQKAGNCFIPIPFERSLKVTLTDPVGFYHFVVEKYPAGTPLKSFDGTEDRSFLKSIFDQIGEELAAPTGTQTTTISDEALEPNQRLVVLQTEGGGTVSRIVLEGPATEDFLNQVEIEARWDGALHPQVLAPVGMFFADAVRPHFVRSLPTKVELLPNDRIRLTSYWRMPFWRNGVIVLVNRGDKPIGPISAEAHLAPQVYPEDATGYFHAQYRDGRTEMGRDWLFADAVGTGKFVGAVQTMFGMHYCEGDEHFTVDGAGMPQVNGTGSEDYYLGCYWPNCNFNLPFAGCVGNITEIPGPACYYRFHVDAPIPFYSSLDARIQHGGNSDIVSHYRSLAFTYLRRRPALKQTDLLDVANEASEQAHAYSAPESSLTGILRASYEGQASTTLMEDQGRHHQGGSIQFELAIDPSNSGVLLRRRCDQATGRQRAEVWVDGVAVGPWYHADQNEYLRWFDDEFDLPASITQGKTKIQVRLVVDGAFNDFRYEAFCYETR